MQFGAPSANHALGGRLGILCLGLPLSNQINFFAGRVKTNCWLGSEDQLIGTVWNSKPSLCLGTCKDTTGFNKNFPM